MPSDTSSTSLVLSSESDSGAEETAGMKDNEKQLPQLKGIEDLITRLYHFSTIIRKSTQSTEIARVQRYVEEELKDLDLTKLASHVRWQVHKQCPSLEENSPLFQHLVEGVLYRRKRILYSASHQRRSAHGLNNVFSWFTQFVPYPNLPLARDDKMAKNQIQLGSGVSTLRKARKRDLDIPPIPPPVAADVEDIRCPYCSQVINIELGEDDSMRDSRWRYISYPPKYTLLRTPLY